MTKTSTKSATKGTTASPTGTANDDTKSASAESAKDELATQARAARQAAEEEAKLMSEAARDKAEHMAKQTSETVAGEARKAAAQMREAGDAFDPNSLAHAAADQLAENLASAARAVRDTDLSSIQRDLAQFARNNPLVFFGGAAVLGFAAGRMMKASERAEPTHSSTQASAQRNHVADFDAPAVQPAVTEPRWGYSS